MQPRCSICWAVQNLAKCSKEGCPNLLCALHGNRYLGRCFDCWETAHILLLPSLGLPRRRLTPAIWRN